MIASKEPILKLLTYLIKKSTKYYCWPSQESIVEILKTQYSCQLSRRTLNRHLRKLEDQSFIKRIKRTSRGPDNQPRFASSLYFIKKKVFSWLKQQAEYLKFIGFSIRVSIVDQKKAAQAKAQAEKLQDKRLPPEEALAYLRKLKASLVG
ncbi:hypothetical protein ES702_07346 [subsurface metagenome]